jgi:ABC-type Mn2+/Zn2+ transport system ATPase subunit
MEACIDIRDLHVQRDGAAVLHGLSLQVACGERLIIAGPNGAGKTTLLKVLLGLLPWTSGTVDILGAAVGSREWSRGRQRVGYVHQETVQVDFPVSGGEVVEMGACALSLGRAEKRRRVQEAMAAVDCGHLRGRMYARLSGGEKQKLSLARCLCQGPELLLLDEPTSSLDPGARAEILHLLDTLHAARSLTMVMVSHDGQVLTAPGWRVQRLESGAFA